MILPFSYYGCETCPTRSPPPNTSLQKPSGIKSKPRDKMISGSSMIFGGTFNYHNHTSRGMDLLMEWVATDAFHNSDELYDSQKFHPQTRVAVLDHIIKWFGKSESARDDFIMWLFGPAGAGKSAIAKRIAEIAADMGMLIATFFFSRTSPSRSNKDRLIATLAYQLAVSIPHTRSYIEAAIERDPTIFRKNVQTQIETLLIKPLQSISSTQIVPSKKLIIIDGLDECNDSKSQVAILEAISHSFIQHNLLIIFLIVSRPEPDLVTSFTCNESLKSIHRRLALDDTYRPDDDIRRFLSDRFEHIKRTHLLRSTIPISWPSQETLDTLVKKSSGQFIYASAVIKFVESSCHRPAARLNIVLGVSPPGTTNPFAELDALYRHLLSSVDDIQITLRVLSLYVMTPNFAPSPYHSFSDMDPELFLSLEPGDIHLALINLSSIVTYNELSGEVKVLHASLVDFLSDKHRSTAFYIDKASICTDFVRRTLQYVKGPDGIRAGDMCLCYGATVLLPYIPKGQLRSDILNFDLDALINASARWPYKDHPYFIRGSTTTTFWIWKKIIDDVALEDIDKKKALERFNKSFESRLNIYQFDWRLQLLVALAVANNLYFQHYGIPCCRCFDILLEMDDHNLHHFDQNALDLRHAFCEPGLGIVLPHVDDDTNALAAFHCMRFLSNPPKHSEKNKCPEMGLIYVEWKATCAMTLEMLCKLLEQANTSPELVQLLSNHDIHPAVKKDFPAKRVRKVDMHILAFLSRAGVFSNWRTIQRPLIISHQQPSNFEENNASSDEDEEWRVIDNFTQQRLDLCCLNVHANHV